MKKVKSKLSSVRSMIMPKRCAAVFSASVIALSSVTCAAQFSLDSDAAVNLLNGGAVGQKTLIELSESYLSPYADNNISVFDIPESVSSVNGEECVSAAEMTQEITQPESGKQKETDVTEEKTTSAEKTTAAATEEEKQTQAVSTTAPSSENMEVEAANAPAEAAGGGYTFSQLGINQMSDIQVPDDILFDENGVPLNYSRVLTGRATAYNMGTTTATGTRVHPGVVAVNPNIIPYGSKMYIVASDGSGYVYGYASAEDTGGFIYWNNAPLVDMYVNSYDDACVWGNRPVTVYIF